MELWWKLRLKLQTDWQIQFQGLPEIRQDPICVWPHLTGQTTITDKHIPIILFDKWVWKSQVAYLRSKNATLPGGERNRRIHSIFLFHKKNKVSYIVGNVLHISQCTIMDAHVFIPMLYLFADCSLCVTFWFVGASGKLVLERVSHSLLCSLARLHCWELT